MALELRSRTGFGKLNSVFTGIENLDSSLGGFRHSELILLETSRSSAGITLALNIAHNITTDPNWAEEKSKDRAIGFFSSVVSSEYLALNMIAYQANMPVAALKRGHLTESDLGRIVKVSQQLATSQVFFDDTQNIDMRMLRNRVRGLKARCNLSLVGNRRETGGGQV